MATEKSGNVNFLGTQRQLTLWFEVGYGEFQPHTSTYACHHYCKYEKDLIKTAEKHFFFFFPLKDS